MSNSNVTLIKKEIRKWVCLSQRFKTSSIIHESKIKCQLAVFEKRASLKEINELQSELGWFYILGIQCF